MRFKATQAPLCYNEVTRPGSVADAVPAVS